MCCQAAEEDEERDEDDASLAAFGCLRALSTVLESVSSLPEIFPTLEPIVLPILQKMISRQGNDVIEELLEILSYFTYFSPQVLAISGASPLTCVPGALQ